MGSRELYQWVDDHPALEMRPSEFTNDPSVIARNDGMISINSALAVDLTGQVASDTSASGRWPSSRSPIPTSAASSSTGRSAGTTCCPISSCREHSARSPRPRSSACRAAPRSPCGPFNESVYRRFLAHRSVHPHDEMQAMADTDQQETVGFVAIEPGQGDLVATARYDVLGDQQADIAFVVRAGVLHLEARFPPT
jgi:hypothetical protein